MCSGCVSFKHPLPGPLIACLGRVLWNNSKFGYCELLPSASVAFSVSFAASKLLLSTRSEHRIVNNFNSRLDEKQKLGVHALSESPSLVDICIDALAFCA